MNLNLADFPRNLRFVGNSLWLCFFPILSAIVAAFALTALAQGREVLRAITDLQESDLLGLGEGWWRLLTFFLGYVCWGLANWYSSRLLLEREFAALNLFTRADTPFIKSWRKWFPRLLPVGAMGALALVLLSDSRYLASGLVASFATIIVALFVWQRRSFFHVKDGAERMRASLAEGDRIALWLALSSSFVLLLGLAAANYWLARFLGSPAILFLALANITLGGSVILIYLPMAYGWPAMTWIPVVAYFLFPQLGLNHNHRISDRPEVQSCPPDIRPDVAEHLSRWLHDGRDDNRPMILVAAEGGASRSGWWTAHVLGAADYATGGVFSKRVFAVSGISGGSLGVSTYVSLLARRDADASTRQRTPKFPDTAACESLLGANATVPLSVQSECFVGRDVLSTTLGYMLFPDFAQRFLPWAMPSWDRSYGLETAWRNDWFGLFGESTFASPLLDMYRPDKVPGAAAKLRTDIPVLLLNSARASAGRPVSQAPVRFRSREVDDLFEFWPHGLQLPLAALVHNSARFPLVSPGGEVYVARKSGDEYWDALVDGGYFENSGAFALRQMLLSLEQGDWEVIKDRIRILYITNDPTSSSQGDCACDDRDGFGQAAIKQEEWLTPILGLYQARSSRADTSRRELEALFDLRPDPTKPTPVTPRRSFLVPLAGAEVTAQQPSMNWFLTPKSRSVMWNSLAIEGTARKALCDLFKELGDETQAKQACDRLSDFRIDDVANRGAKR